MLMINHKETPLENLLPNYKTAKNAKSKTGIFGQTLYDVSAISKREVKFSLTYGIN